MGTGGGGGSCEGCGELASDPWLNRLRRARLNAGGPPATGRPPRSARAVRQLTTGAACAATSMAEARRRKRACMVLGIESDRQAEISGGAGSNEAGKQIEALDHIVATQYTRAASGRRAAGGGELCGCARQSCRNMPTAGSGVRASQPGEARSHRVTTPNPLNASCCSHGGVQHRRSRSGGAWPRVALCTWRRRFMTSARLPQLLASNCVACHQR